jgi:hypothetical protein
MMQCFKVIDILGTAYCIHFYIQEFVTNRSVTGNGSLDISTASARFHLYVKLQEVVDEIDSGCIYTVYISSHTRDCSKLLQRFMGQLCWQKEKQRLQ